MVISISADLEEKMFGDEAVIRYLDIERQRFESGDRSALLDALALCANFQAVIPEWASDALLEALENATIGKAKDFNEVFGWRGGKREQKERAKLWRQQELAQKVIGHMLNHRLSGGGLNADIDPQLIADELNISRRDVEDIYKHQGQFIKSLPKGNPDGGVYGFGMGKTPIPRRRGRPILRDDNISLDTKSKNSVSD